jgi:transcriptional antiterminator RfaH
MVNQKAVDGASWYVIVTHPKQEDRAENNLRAWNVETFYPKLRERHENPLTGRTTFVIKPFFPRYMFARFDAKILHKVWYTRGVHSVVSFGGNPAVVEDEIIALTQARVSLNGYIEIEDGLKSGDQVIIKKGPLANFMGVFERQVKHTDRVMILLTTVGYQSRLVIERQHIDRLPHTTVERFQQMQRSH